jgi:hypothetical protein
MESRAATAAALLSTLRRLMEEGADIGGSRVRNGDRASYMKN